MIPNSRVHNNHTSKTLRTYHWQGFCYTQSSRHWEREMEDQLTEMAAINTKCTFTDLKTKVVTPEDPEAKLLAWTYSLKFGIPALLRTKICNKKSTNFCVRIELLLMQQQDSRPLNRLFKTRLPEHTEPALWQDLWQWNDAAKQLQKHYKNQKRMPVYIISKKETMYYSYKRK